MMRKLLENIFLLSAIKFFDLFIPLIIIPFVITKVGLSSYGVFAVCLTIFNFILTFNDFGLNTLLAKKISQSESAEANKNNTILFTNIKLGLSIVSALIFYLFALIKGGEYIYVTLFFIMGAIFESISPVAYFQGIQRLWLASFSQFSCRLLSALFVFFVIKKEGDIALYSFLHNLSYVLNCIILLILLDKKHKICMKISVIRRHEFNIIFQEAWHIYSFRFISGLINPLISIFLSSYYGAIIVSIYSVSQRVCSAASRLYEPINNAIFPHISYMAIKNFKAFQKQSFIYISFLIFSSILVCAALFFYKDIIQNYLIGRVFIGNEKLIYFYALANLLPSVLSMYLTYMLIAINKAHKIRNSLLLNILVTIIGLIIIKFIKLEAYYVAALIIVSYTITVIGLAWSLYNSMKNINIKG